MPRTAFFSKETITAAALEIVRTKGADALTARALGKELNCSLSPIFTVYDNMDQIQSDVRKAAAKLFDDYVSDVTDYMPAFKEFGMRMVRFAKQEQNLFRMLFLDKDASTSAAPGKVSECLEDIERDYGFSHEQTLVLFRQIWPLACGLAVINAQNPDACSEEDISEILSCEFTAMMYFLKSGRPVVNITPHLRKPDERTTMDFKMDK
ncbi:MAG: hypothetical protein ACI3ZL_02045 [Candidatus Cryptobacteroides sp.]